MVATVTAAAVNTDFNTLLLPEARAKLAQRGAYSEQKAYQLLI
jgi:hypothetical protein